MQMNHYIFLLVFYGLTDNLEILLLYSFSIRMFAVLFEGLMNSVFWERFCDFLIIKISNQISKPRYVLIFSKENTTHLFVVHESR